MQTFIHLLAHPQYSGYYDSLGKGTHAHNALAEGVVSLLTEIVWSDVRPRDRALRAVIKGEYASHPPLRSDRMPNPADVRYPSMAEVSPSAPSQARRRRCRGGGITVREGGKPAQADGHPNERRPDGGPPGGGRPRG